VHYPDKMEVYAVTAVTSAESGSSRPATDYQPFYSYRHSRAGDDRQPQAFWYASRRQSLREGDRGTDVFLHLVDLNFDPRQSAEEVLLARALCTNRDLPAQLKRPTFDLVDMAAPLSRISCPRPPSPALRPRPGRGSYWRLLSHLNLNYLSLTDPEEGRAALQEILRLYDFTDAEPGRPQGAVAVNRKLIEGIVGLGSRRVVGRTSNPAASGFCQGIEVTLELDEPQYSGTGVYLFASVLERFLGLYASINSFSQLVLRTKQRPEDLKKWPPRAGEQVLL